MKKLFVAALLSSLILMTADANYSDFYIKADTGVGITANKNFTVSSDNSSTTINAKTAEYLIASFGFGSYVTENLRAELNISKHFDPVLKGLYNENPVQFNFKKKVNAYASFVNLYIDTMDLGSFKFFVGGGLGASKIQEDILVYNDSAYSYLKVNKANNLAWMLSGGLTYMLSKNIDLDVSYKYSDLGKSKATYVKPSSETFKIGDSRFTNHSVTVGIKFYL